MRRFGLRLAFTYMAFLFASRWGWWQGLWFRPALWLDSRVFHMPYPLRAEDGVLNNTTFGTVSFVLYVVAALLVAAIWTLADRRRDDARLQAWLMVLLRVTLAMPMIHYGMIKVWPTQMIAPPPPGVLGRPIGDLMPNHLLWWTVGASPLYESVLGWAELTGGVLLLLPRTTLLGGLLCAANMLTVFVMNVCYDVPVKLMSLHFFVMAALLVWPHVGRLVALFRNERVEPVPPSPLLPRRFLDYGVHLAIAVLGVYAIFGSYGEAQERKAKLYPPRPPLFGAWQVATFTGSGPEAEQWRWLTFTRPGTVSVQLASGGGRRYKIAIDPARGTFSLDGGAPLALRVPDADTFILDGSVDGGPLHAVMRRAPLTRR
jgi:uncharacterized membrane protein YphA (DoxX/SURF4 family)